MQTLNVYSNDYRICLAQKFIGEKTNEVPAAQEALRIMDIKGTIITADAMNCQKDTAAVIMDGKEDYALALKGTSPCFITKSGDTLMTDAGKHCEKRKDVIKRRQKQNMVQPSRGNITSRRIRDGTAKRMNRGD